MKITYDKIANAAYIYLKKFKTVSKTKALSDEVILDLGPKGEVLGIEILNASSYLTLNQLKNAKLQII